MGETYEITGAQLENLLAEIAWAQQGARTIRKISICVDDGAKVKINEHGWTLPMGTLREKG